MENVKPIFLEVVAGLSNGGHVLKMYQPKEIKYSVFLNDDRQNSTLFCSIERDEFEMLRAAGLSLIRRSIVCNIAVETYEFVSDINYDVFSKAGAQETEKAETDTEATEKITLEVAGLKAKYEKFEAAMKEYSKLPVWKRLFVKPPKMEE